MLDSEFVKTVAKLGIESVKPELINVEDNHTAVMVNGSIVHRFKKDEPFGNLTVADFNSFVVAATKLVALAETSVVRVTKAGIVLVCDDNKPHKKAKVELKYNPTAAYECLLAWEGNSYRVSSINKLLRTKLFSTFDEKYLAIFKQVEFARSGSTVVSKTANRDTMGKSVDNAVKSAAGDIPEVLMFQTQLLQNVPCEPVLLKYYVDVNHENETIGIAPMGDIVDRAMTDTVDYLVGNLTAHLSSALVVAS